MMRLGIMISLGAALAVVSALWFVLGGTVALEARFTNADCRHVALRLPANNRMVAGASDMALSPDGTALIVAAIDRSDQFRPFGGLFSVSLLDLQQGVGEIEVSEFVEYFRLDGGVRPQAFAFSPDGEQLALINRIGQDGDVTVIDVLDREGDYYRASQRYTNEAFCRAHDLAFELSGGLVITRDRGQCKLRINDMIPGNPTGLILRISPEGTLSADEEYYHYPTGVAIGPSGNPIVAEMKSGMLKGGYVNTLLPGGPEHLTLDQDGALIAAVHPNLFQRSLYVNGFAFSAPSRIVRLDPERTDYEILYDDPDGSLISAASVGLMHDNVLYMGSPTDEGIVVCEEDAAPAS